MSIQVKLVMLGAQLRVIQLSKVVFAKGEYNEEFVITHLFRKYKQ